MNAVNLAESIILAERYLRVAKIAAKVLKDDTYYGGKETAAAKRASMDLTRALADVRRAG